MKKLDAEQAAKFSLFSLPCYFTFPLIFIALFVWKTDISHPDFILVMLITAIMLFVSFLLIKGHYLITIPMIALGGYIAMQDDQHMGGAFFYCGLYLMLHYLICGIYVFKTKHTHKEE